MFDPDPEEFGPAFNQQNAGYLHLEQMDRRNWYLGIGDLKFNLHVSEGSGALDDAQRWEGHEIHRYAEVVNQMKHGEFRIGGEFWCAGGRWRCTDIGTRTIVGIKLDRVDVQYGSGSVRYWVLLRRRPKAGLRGRRTRWRSMCSMRTAWLIARRSRRSGLFPERQRIVFLFRSASAV